MLFLDCGMTAIGTRLDWTLMSEKLRQENNHENAALVFNSLVMQEVDVSYLWRLYVLRITAQA